MQISFHKGKKRDGWKGGKTERKLPAGCELKQVAEFTNSYTRLVAATLEIQITQFGGELGGSRGGKLE